ncbi:hypothetical protein BD289DRAFT_52438 [Coniella lustricola]|uniref:Uncharacterized protein n=1 Tax=Coniella lustricola TaxID=2025994 RepID=A0A2T3A149_9PEZI|nr:hypothetical protein BD289DRAFT_52438 [Coniella lustricola]
MRVFLAGLASPTGKTQIRIVFQMLVAGPLVNRLASSSIYKLFRGTNGALPSLLDTTVAPHGINTSSPISKWCSAGRHVLDSAAVLRRVIGASPAEGCVCTGRVLLATAKVMSEPNCNCDCWSCWALTGHVCRVKAAVSGQQGWVGRARLDAQPARSTAALVPNRFLCTAIACP